VLLNGALNTGMPRWRAASRSTWLVPMQKQPMLISLSAWSSTSAVMVVRLRMPSICTPRTASFSAAPSSAFFSRPILA